MMKQIKASIVKQKRRHRIAFDLKI